ncbi:MAG TPA: RDD family protein [Solirubrobacteraceae bacterium]|nr:RDD family protein [Solirubrobacteraceae bacterium]
MDGGQIIGRRIAAALIDSAIVLILLVVVAKTLGDGDSNRSIWAETEGGSARPVFFALTFAYYLGTELVWAQTIGKRVMKLRVVKQDGSRLDPAAAFIRNLVRVVDWLPGLYIVGAITLFATGERRLRLGDLAARTKVVADTGAPPPPAPPPERPDDDDVLAQVLR